MPNNIKGVLVALTLVAGSAQAQSSTSVEMWVRAPGQHAQRHLTRLELKVVELRTLPLRAEEKYDVQYKAKARFRGVALGTLLSQHPKSLLYDTALLHFENGMAVPVPLGKSTAVETLAALVALDIETANDKGAVWNKELPDVRKAVEKGRDVRPIRFRGNKVVVSELWHPAVPQEEKEFSPWLHVDRLTGIEFVQEGAYYKQLGSAFKGSAQAGFQRYVQYCQFCHGARRVGAQFGWDYVEPLPLSSYRDKASLLLHVKYREGDAAERGLMMPALGSLKEADIGPLWDYLDKLGKTPPPPYEP